MGGELRKLGKYSNFFSHDMHLVRLLATVLGVRPPLALGPPVLGVEVAGSFPAATSAYRYNAGYKKREKEVHKQLD